MSSHETDDKYLELAHELMRNVHALARCGPHHAIQASMQGLPAVMRILFEQDHPISPGELAQRTQVTDARIANVLRVLEERDLIERKASQSDRRRVEVSLTPKGRKMAKERRQKGTRLLVSFLERLGYDDTEELVRLLRRIVELMNEFPIQDTMTRKRQRHHAESQGER